MTEEELLCRGVVVFRQGGRIAIETDAEAFPGFDDLGVITLDDIARLDSFAVGGHGDRRPMAIGAGDHGNLVAGKAMIASEDVRGQIGPRDLPDVEQIVRVGPGHAHVDTVSQKSEPR